MTARAGAGVTGGGRLISLADAVARVTALARPIVDIEEVSLNDVLGRVLAEDVRAGVPLPPFDSASMDGYAVDTRRLAGPPPYRLPVVARIAAGDGEALVPTPGAARIFTGAPVPAGCDAVIMQERCTVDGGDVLIETTVTSGLNVRRRGEDVAADARVLTAGTLLDPRHIAIAAATGVPRLRVRRQARVALLSTGSELREPDEPLTFGAIHESNRPMLAALLCTRDARVTDLGSCRDQPSKLADVLGAAARGHDLILTSGGVSVGEEDHLPAVLDSLGRQVEILKIGMKPGKPAAAAQVGEAVVLALPGNPFSALVSFLMLGVPLLARITGASGMELRPETGCAGFAEDRPRDRDEFVPVRIDGADAYGRPRLVRTGPGGSARLLPLVAAEGMALLPKSASSIAPGDALDFYSFRDAFSTLGRASQ